MGGQFHDHNTGGIFLVLSPGDAHRESTLVLTDNKRTRTQIKACIARGDGRAAPKRTQQHAGPCPGGALSAISPCKVF